MLERLLRSLGLRRAPRLLDHKLLRLHLDNAGPRSLLR